MSIVYILLISSKRSFVIKKQSEPVELLLTALNTLGFTSDDLIKLAVETGFTKRLGGKIEPLDFIGTLCQTSISGGASCNDIGSRLNLRNSESVTKQAVWLKLNDACKIFTERILALIITTNAGMGKENHSTMHSTYDRILVQDSTVIKLPARLFDEYSGVSNGKSIVCNARIQVVYDVLACQFVMFKVEKYSKNDLSAAPDLQLQDKDLVLRDRGYLTMGEIERHIAKGADCIYRHKYRTIYLDPETGDQIDLLGLLKKHRKIDMQVRLNNEDKTVVRLLAAPVSEEVANRRRRNLKKQTNGHCPSSGLLKMASWSIFITTIEAEKATFEEILEIYGLRWRIEIVFKAWKSHMNFSTFNNVPAAKLLILINARIIMITLLNNCVYKLAVTRVKTHYNRTLSMIKLTKVMTTQLARITETIKVLTESSGKHPSIKYLSNFCTYDNRKRENYEESRCKILSGTLA